MNFTHKHPMTPVPDAVIVAAGDFPSHPAAYGAIERFRDRIICCDGAADALLRAGFMPLAVAGDGDSISETARDKVADRLHLESEQETNDLTKAVRYALKQGHRRLLIVGATGKREDHTLGNISLLADYMDKATVEMRTDYGIFTPTTGHTSFASYTGQQISVFCVDSEPLTLRNVRWPLTRQRITRWWQGTLNEALSDQFEVETEGKVIVFRAY